MFIESLARLNYLLKVSDWVTSYQNTGHILFAYKYWNIDIYVPLHLIILLNNWKLKKS